jgi:hypothetical protein
MTTDAEDKGDKLERALEAEQKRLREVGKEADALDREINPPSPPLDHSDEGGVI